ncbi:hypothetical protein PAPYR_9701 [Paratrimastix pyriformis]|uniref:Uncharacterized protein n=1 Tax=Paratrimastix pyriformis TaxID=342808 RepID=A0ABQ8U9D9_9EUKA|nr:hypothetical protein PAPYR_9701 [Paratrimastix pyriformis]
MLLVGVRVCLLYIQFLVTWGAWFARYSNCVAAGLEVRLAEQFSRGFTSVSVGLGLSLGISALTSPFQSDLPSLPRESALLDLLAQALALSGDVRHHNKNDSPTHPTHPWHRPEFSSLLLNSSMTFLAPVNVNFSVNAGIGDADGRNGYSSRPNWSDNSAVPCSTLDLEDLRNRFDRILILTTPTDITCWTSAGASELSSSLPSASPTHVILVASYERIPVTPLSFDLVIYDQGDTLFAPENQTTLCACQQVPATRRLLLATRASFPPPVLPTSQAVIIPGVILMHLPRYFAVLQFLRANEALAGAATPEDLLGTLAKRGAAPAPGAIDLEAAIVDLFRPLVVALPVAHTAAGDATPDATLLPPTAGAAPAAPVATPPAPAPSGQQQATCALTVVLHAMYANPQNGPRLLTDAAAAGAQAPAPVKMHSFGGGLWRATVIVPRQQEERQQLKEGETESGQAQDGGELASGLLRVRLCNASGQPVNTEVVSPATARKLSDLSLAVPCTGPLSQLELRQVSLYPLALGSAPPDPAADPPAPGCLRISGLQGWTSAVLREVLERAALGGPVAMRDLVWVDDATCLCLLSGSEASSRLSAFLTACDPRPDPYLARPWPYDPASLAASVGRVAAGTTDLGLPGLHDQQPHEEPAATAARLWVRQASQREADQARAKQATRPAAPAAAATAAPGGPADDAARRLRRVLLQEEFRARDRDEAGLLMGHPLQAATGPCALRGLRQSGLFPEAAGVLRAEPGWFRVEREGPEDWVALSAAGVVRALQEQQEDESAEGRPEESGWRRRAGGLDGEAAHRGGGGAGGRGGRGKRGGGRGGRGPPEGMQEFLGQQGSMKFAYVNFATAAEARAAVPRIAGLTMEEPPSRPSCVPTSPPPRPCLRPPKRRINERHAMPRTARN